jgi:hypothetical protein
MTIRGRGLFLHQLGDLRQVFWGKVLEEPETVQAFLNGWVSHRSTTGSSWPATGPVIHLSMGVGLCQTTWIHKDTHKMQ